MNHEYNMERFSAHKKPQKKSKIERFVTYTLLTLVVIIYGFILTVGLTTGNWGV